MPGGFFTSYGKLTTYGFINADGLIYLANSIDRLIKIIVTRVGVIEIG